MKDIIIKKPQQRRSKDKFQAILQASIRVLNTYGFEKTTTAKIALEAEVSIGTLYDYFSCKEAVLIAYIDDQLNKALSEVYEMAQNNESAPKETLKALIQVGVNFAYQHRDIIKLIFTYFTSDIRLINLQQSKDQLTAIALEFANNKQLLIKDKDPNLMIYAMTNVILGFQCRIVLMPSEDFDVEVIVRELTQIVSDYIFIQTNS